jgi:hypothetical protein
MIFVLPDDSFFCIVFQDVCTVLLSIFSKYISYGKINIPLINF